jgi:probable H4MPT-linked C1 transfer pathway protein
VLSVSSVVSIGLDIGGANLKAAHLDGTACFRPFPLWRNPSGLGAALGALLAELPPASRLAVTMTGELADCFPSKRDGVAAILDAVAAVAAGRTVRVWQTEGRFVDPATARARPLSTASANWLALARFAGRFAPEGPALLLDVGSTTTDIVPLMDGRPAPMGRTDPERLRSGELVYKGARRTPLCALTDGAGAAELFATTLDVHLLLGLLPENPADTDTADGRPATRAGAHARLARMWCADLESSSERERIEYAEGLHRRLVRQLAAAVACVARRLPGAPRTLVLAGSGEFLARRVLAQIPFHDAVVVSLAERLGPVLSTAACAHAVAVLAAEDPDFSHLTPDPSPPGEEGSESLIVVKVGGSLFDLPDLGPRLVRYLAALPHPRVLLVPGGGPTTDVIRAFDQRFGLGDEKAHWLALGALTLNAHVLGALLPGAVVVQAREQILAVMKQGGRPILDPCAFLKREPEVSARLPPTWDAASDTVAASVALALGAKELVLLKSIDISENADCDEMVRRGWVDSAFADLLRSGQERLRLRIVNLRGALPSG